MSESHSRISASALSRIIPCPGSVALIEQLKKEKKIPEGTTNSAARKGTAVHEAIEKVLLGEKSPRDFRKESIKVYNQSDGSYEQIKLETNDIKNVRNTVKWAWSQTGEDAILYPERKFIMSDRYGIDFGGTGDITICEMQGTIHIGDYKNGRVVVNATNNPQMRAYGLGAYLEFNDEYDFQDVKTTIIQPNSYHKLGPIRSDHFTVEELLEWEDEILKPTIIAVRDNTGNLVPDEKKQCYWCEAKAHCPARQASKRIVVSDVVSSTGMNDDVLVDGSFPEPETLSEKQLDSVLQNAEIAIKFYSDCKKYALKKLEEDRDAIPGWNITPKLGNRKFVEVKKFTRLIKKRKLKLDELSRPQPDKPMTVTELEKFLHHEKEWSQEDVAEFMDEITTRDASGYHLQKSEGAVEDFSDFA